MDSVLTKMWVSAPSVLNPLSWLLSTINKRMKCKESKYVSTQKKRYFQCRNRQNEIYMYILIAPKNDKHAYHFLEKHLMFPHPVWQDSEINNINIYRTQMFYCGLVYWRQRTFSGYFSGLFSPNKWSSDS